MVIPLLQKLCCGVPELNLSNWEIFNDDDDNFDDMMRMIMMMSSHHPRKMGRKEMAVGRIQAKAIIKQATLTVMRMIRILMTMMM